jgi:DNA-binding response OmpR family regulator
VNGPDSPGEALTVERDPAFGSRAAMKECLMSSAPKTAEGIVALFNASDDTIDMVQNLLARSNSEQTLIWCHFADLKKGVIDFEKYMAKHNPEVVIFDLSPPYDENWHFFKTMRDAKVMRKRGIVLTTTNKNRLDEVLGEDSFALEVVGRPHDLQQIDAAIKAETRKAEIARLAS